MVSAPSFGEGTGTVGDSRLGLVLIHGFMSGPKVWEPLRELIAADRGLGFVAPLAFEYATGLLPVHPLRAIPSIDTVADSLKEYLTTEAGAFDQLLLVTHSQGGLVAQRYLARMLHDGKGRELARIQRLVMLACPSNGSELALSLRRRALGARNPQEKDLRPLADRANEALHTVIRDVVHATAITDRTCPIPVSVYAGESDRVVSRASAHSSFSDRSALPGDHFSILKADSPQHRTFTTLRRHLLATRSEPYVPGPEPEARPEPAGAFTHTPAGEEPSGKRRRQVTVIASAAALAAVAAVLYFAPMPWKSTDTSSVEDSTSPAAGTGSSTPDPKQTDGGVAPPAPATNAFWFAQINPDIDKKAEILKVDKNQKFQFWWNGGVKNGRLHYGGKGENLYSPAPGADGAALRFGDIDGDQWPDCMVVDPTGKLTVHTWVKENKAGRRMCMRRYDGDADVPLLATADRVPDLKEIQFADIDGDKKVDYLWVEPSSKVTVWFNRGFTDAGGEKRLQWSPPTRTSTTVYNRELRFADLDGNGRADQILITPNGGANAWLNLSGAESGIDSIDIHQIVPDTGAPPEEIQFADVDGDGKAEFLHIDKSGAIQVREPVLPKGTQEPSGPSGD
ncbi:MULTISPECIES: FG-GAP-like repeat-containing protein [Streptomyces]|uniref:FG-GAP-like repeat-containing protein n=1 Tax=Streptomyces ramulosus TaxID=47762 RepID=A0ABW1FJC0_9ACTN